MRLYLYPPNLALYEHLILGPQTPKKSPFFPSPLSRKPIDNVDW